MMPGVALEEIRDAIEDAFDERTLTMTMRELMNVRLNNVIEAGPFGWRVFNLIQWAEMNGREVELIQALGRSRPTQVKMRAIYNKYGLAVPVYVESGGARQADDLTTGGGLEQIVSPHLAMLDYGVWQEKMAQTGGRVCMIRVAGAPQGTGFLVGPDAVLTNYHVMEAVLKGRRQASEVSCVFDFKKAANGEITETPVPLHATDWKIDDSPYAPQEASGKTDQGDPTADQLDYALIKLASAVGNTPWSQKADPNDVTPGKVVKRGWVRVPDAAPEFRSPMGVLIAQHPSGWPLKVALDTRAIDRATSRWLNASGTRVRYATNTLGGSSGSPVFDLEWNLIALHHYGDSLYSHTKEKSNQGIPIDRIRARLTQGGKAGALGGDPPA